MINLQELLEKLRPEMVGISRRARYQDGWLDVDESATYASATSITLAVDVQDMFPTGCRARLKQSAGTWKYFTVVSSSVDVSDILTLNLLGGSDYSVANEAISRMQVSYMSGAQPGWPGWFNWAPSYGGFSSDPLLVLARFCVTGRTVQFVYSASGDGTSNGTTFTISLPVKAYDDGVAGSKWTGMCGYSRDNSAALASGSRWAIQNGGTVVNLYPSSTVANWTASGGKRSYLEGFYEF